MPQAIGAAIIAAVNWVVAEGAAVVASDAFIVPFTTGSTVLGVTSAEIVGTIVINAVAFAATSQSGPNLQSQKVNTRNPVASRRKGYGICKIGGVVVFLRRSTVTDDGILYVVVVLNSGKIDSILKHFVSDQITRIDETGIRPGPVGAAVYPAVWLDGQRVTIHYYLGEASQTADSLLLAAFPGQWTDAHRLDGLTYAVIKANGTPLEDFAEVYKAGIPSYRAVAKMSWVWDPRVSGQDPDDPETWAWSDNAALIIMDYLWSPDGMRLPRSMIDLGIDRWIAVANCCDDLVPLLNGGTEKRYRLSGEYDFTEPPKNVLARMLLPIDGRLHLRADGAIILDIGEFCEPAITITDEDILSYDMRRGPSKIDLKNEIRATYAAPGFDYEQQEADPWRNESSIDVDGLQSASLNLDWCPSQSQARRRMKVEAIRQNPEWQGSIVTNAKGALLLGQRYVRLQISDLELDTTFYIQKSNIDLLNGICTFDLSAFPSTAYDFDPIPHGSGVFTSEEGVSPEANCPGDHGIVVPEGATQVVITADGAGGGGSDRGAGGGARSIKTIAIDPADWGAVILYTVGAHGIGEAVNVTGGVMTDGGNSTVTGTLAAGSIAMTAHGGHKGTNTAGAGGTASGGDTNTSGSNGGGPDGGAGASGADSNLTPGGGGDLQTDGGDGSVTFEWTF